MALAMIALALLMGAVLFRFTGYRYQRRAVGEWFANYCRENPQGFSRRYARRSVNGGSNCEAAFQAMGTNAVPYLTSFITGDLTGSNLDPLLRHLGVTPRALKAGTAAHLLADVIKPPGEMLVPLLEPALTGSNAYNRSVAFWALQGISSGYDRAKPHLERALNSSDRWAQRDATLVLERFGAAHGNWAVPRLSELLSNSTAVMPALLTIEGPAALAKLEARLLVESNQTTRIVISNAIRNAASQPIR